MEKALIIAPGLDNFLAEFTIGEVKPKHVAFLSTEDTTPLIYDIVKKTGITSYKLFFIKDIFSTSETIEEFLNAFQWVKGRGDVDEIFVDATNCITVIEMATYVSASLIDLFKDLLEEEIQFRFVYVHSEFEKKEDGVMGEVRGTEKLVELEKPKEGLSFVLAFDAIRALNRGKYEQARNDFLSILKDSKGSQNLLYAGLAYLSKGYEEWDKMQIADAIESLELAIESLSKAKGFSYIYEIIPKIKQNLNALYKVREEDALEIIMDLYENAFRREKEGRLDDALARLYACLERITQFQLLSKGINTKNPDYSKLPEDVVNSFKQEVGFLPDELELKKNGLLLILLEDPIGKELREITYRKFIGLIGLRNSSILAHGFHPIGRRSFEDFKAKLSDIIFKRFAEVHSIKPEYIAAHKHLKLRNVTEIFQRKGL